MFPIYIPSKGRPDFATARLLNEPHPPYIDPYVVMDIDMEEQPRHYTVFIEPQDAEAYRKAGHASIVVLPENEKGVAYARQAILDYAIQNNDKWFWMIDDDVIQFSAYQLDGYEDAMGRIHPGVLAHIEHHKMPYMNLAGIAVIALEHEIWLTRTAKACEESGKDVKDTAGATTVNICAVFNAPLLKAAGVKYCQELAVLEDVDFCLQLVDKGLRLARFGNYGFKVPTSKTTPGGCFNAWKEETRIKSNELMIERWGECLNFLPLTE